MSVRDELYGYGMSGKMHSPDNSERMSACIDAFKAEVLREAAERIRGLGIETWDDMNEGVHWLRQGRIEAADLIDPDKENSADGTEAGRP